MQKILIIGQGTIGKPVAKILAKQGHHITAVARSPKTHHDGITFWQKDACALTHAELNNFDQIIIIVAPNHHTNTSFDRTQLYKNTYLSICQHIASFDLNIKRVLFVSSTSVYGKNAGEWVDIDTPACPTSDIAHILLKSEQTLQEKFTHRCIIVRPSGIYGTTSKRMFDLAKHAHINGIPNKHYTNRIHQEDLIHILCQIINLDNPKHLYIASDDDPATSLEVVCFICQMMNYKTPKVIKSQATGKRIKGNVSHWLSYRDYKMGYLKAQLSHLDDKGGCE